MSLNWLDAKIWVYGKVIAYRKGVKCQAERQILAFYLYAGKGIEQEKLMVDMFDVKQGRSLDLSKTEALALRAELKAARRKFTKAGGRGVDLAEFIDCARFELRSRAARKAAQTRAAKKT